MYMYSFLHWMKSKAKDNIDTENLVQDGQYVKFDSTDFSSLDHHREVKGCPQLAEQITSQFLEYFSKD